MRKNLQYKILAAVMTLSAVNWAVPTNVLAENYTVKQDGEIISGNFTTVYGNGHSFTINGGDIDTVYGDTSDGNSADSNAVYISGGSVGYVYGGESESGEAHHNTVNISGDAKVTGEVHGGDSTSDKAYNNTVNISGDAKITGEVYGGSSNDGEAYDNTVIISGGSADITNANLYGRNDKASGTGNTLTIDGWSDSTKSVQNFNSINFDNINWQNGETVLTITAGAKNDLANTEIYINSIAGGSKIAVGDTMTLIENTNNVNLGIDKNKITVNNNFFAGVAAEGTGTATVNNDGVDFTIDTLKANSQIDLVAENCAVAAAFVNQGTDLIADSLDTISRDDNYGVKTFAAVHGNRSKYDVNSDIKINGWSVIAGVGNADKFDNGSEFSWGVFYENGSGNYRTYNEFNNEFFRGDGSLVYNGGGIAARYTNKNGVYTEGSLRAGMLKSDMDNALRDGAGNF